MTYEKFHWSYFHLFEVSDKVNIMFLRIIPSSTSGDKL